MPEVERQTKELKLKFYRNPFLRDGKKAVGKVVPTAFFLRLIDKFT